MRLSVSSWTFFVADHMAEVRTVIVTTQEFRDFYTSCRKVDFIF